MKKGWIAALFAVVAIGLLFKPDNVDTSQTQTAPVASKQDGLPDARNLMAKFDVPHEFNANGVVVFHNPKDMFETFNDYSGQNQLKFVSENPLHLTISEYLSKSTARPDDIQLYQRKALLYAVYQVFTHTKADHITVESFPIDMDSHEALTSPLKVSVSRAQALDILKQHSNAQSFDDLVESNENDQFRIPGFSSSELFDRFAYDIANQEKVVSSLMSIGN